MRKIAVLIGVCLLVIEVPFVAGNPLQGPILAPNTFGTMAQCKEALKKGEFQYYVPSFLTGHKPLAAGEELRPLERDACVHLCVVGGKSFVPQKQGTQYVFRDGKMIRRWDCGNCADDAEYLDTITAGITAQPPAQPPNDPATTPPAQQRGIDPLNLLAIIDSFNTFDINDNKKVLDLEEKKSEYDDDKGGGNGKWWALGTAAVAGTVLCIWKCRGGGGGSVNVTNINNSPTTTLVPSTPTAPLGPIGVPVGANNGPGATGNPGTGSGTSTTGPAGPSTLPPSTGN